MILRKCPHRSHLADRTDAVSVREQFKIQFIRKLHAFRGAHAKHVQTVAQHLTDGTQEGKASQGAGRVIGQQHLMLGIVAVQLSGQLREVGAHVVDAKRFGGGGQHVFKRGGLAQQGHVFGRIQPVQ